ncbi:MAG: hypothetical protein IPN69_03065 [Acidobacteria bacterium]|nr:hypothetical protein [Acidobacteriota bacterium]
MNNETFNKLAFDIWEENFSPSENVYVPLILPPLIHSGLLFIGNNPSFSPAGFRRFLTDTAHSNIDPEQFFLWANRNALNLTSAIEIERFAKDKYPYFAKFRDIAMHASLEWEHIDLFFFRETSQKDFKERILRNNKLTAFAEAQLKLSKDLVQHIDPKIIVVVNAFASDLFQTQFETTFNEEFGYYQVQLSGRMVPVFLGSMLTGQRAMDRFSYQRLRWHVKKAAAALR